MNPINFYSTGNAFGEHTRNNRYWGDGSGRNRLGHLLVELREKLRKEEEPHG